MFVQVFQGPVSDPAKVKELLDRWVTELGPGADGWLGSTSGVTDDNWFIGFARFDSESAARHNSERPEQGEWWAELEQQFTSEPAFHESIDVVVDEHGDLDSAGFVQVMQGRTSDPARARELPATTTRRGRTTGRTCSAASCWATGRTPGRWRSTSPARRTPARERRRNLPSRS